MEAVRTGSQSGGIIEIEVDKGDTFNFEVLCARSDDTMRACFIKKLLCVASSCEDNTSNDLGAGVLSGSAVDVFGQGVFHTSKKVIGSLEVNHLNCTDTFGDSTIPLVLVRDQVVELSEDRAVCVVGVSRICVVIHKWFAHVLTGDHIVEDSEAIASIGVGNVVSEFTDL